MQTIDLTWCEKAQEHVDPMHSPSECPFPQPECLDRPRHDGDTACTGNVEYRESLSGTGTPIARCDGHWSLRLKEQDRINRTYPRHAPADFDPMYAGESWDEDY